MDTIIAMVPVLSVLATGIWVKGEWRRARETVAELLEVRIPRELDPLPTGERRRDVRERVTERRRTRRGQGDRRNDLEARLRAMGIQNVDIPEPIDFDVPEDVEDNGMLMPVGREIRN